MTETGQTAAWQLSEGEPAAAICASGAPRRSSVGAQAHAAGDAVALDLTGASGDRRYDGLAVAEAHDAFGGEPVPGTDLHAQPGRRDVGLRTLELRHRTLARARLALRQQPRCPVGQQP